MLTQSEIFDAYNKAMQTNNALVESVAKKMVQDIGRVTLQELGAEYSNLIKLFSAISSSASRDYYQGVRDLHPNLAEFHAEALPVGDYDLFEEVDGVVATSKSADEAASTLSQNAITHIMGAVDATFSYNAQKDSAKPRFALVPHIGACDWCVMIGSKGFDFTTAEKASNTRHPHCRCTVAISFGEDDEALKGYNIGKLKEQYYANDKFRDYLARRDTQRSIKRKVEKQAT